jgi:hypothetical protein
VRSFASLGMTARFILMMCWEVGRGMDWGDGAAGGGTGAAG